MLLYLYMNIIYNKWKTIHENGNYYFLLYHQIVLQQKICQHIYKLIIKFGIYVEDPKSNFQFSMKSGTNIKIIKKSIKFNTFFNTNKGILLILLYFIKIKKWHKDCKINN